MVGRRAELSCKQYVGLANWNAVDDLTLWNAFDDRC